MTTAIFLLASTVNSSVPQITAWKPQANGAGELLNVGSVGIKTSTKSSMIIILTRLSEEDGGIFGKLEGEGISLVTLERTERPIPPGSYRLTVYNKVLLLHGVPNRSMIELHPGNTIKDSKGCILVGSRRKGNAIVDSLVAFTVLYNLVHNYNGPVVLEIR